MITTHYKHNTFGLTYKNKLYKCKCALPGNVIVRIKAKDMQGNNYVARHISCFRVVKRLGLGFCSGLTANIEI